VSVHCEQKTFERTLERVQDKRFVFEVFRKTVRCRLRSTLRPRSTRLRPHYVASSATEKQRYPNFSQCPLKEIMGQKPYFAIFSDTAARFCLAMSFSNAKEYKSYKNSWSLFSLSLPLSVYQIFLLFVSSC